MSTTPKKSSSGNYIPSNVREHEFVFTMSILVICLLLIGCVSVPKSQVAVETKPSHNYVYQQVELVSLVMRLADYQEYNEEITEYQQSLRTTFNQFSNHHAVEYARELRHTHEIGYDAPMHFAFHLQWVENQFQFIDGVDLPQYDDRWTQESAERLLELLNAFYIESNFVSFFQTNVPFYNELSKRLEEELLSRINYDWFLQYGFTKEQMRIAIHPAVSHNFYGTLLPNSTVFAAIPATSRHFTLYYAPTIHEWAHGFANPIAEKWYEENEEFRLLCDSSVDFENLPYYAIGETMAREYVTRAYETLYFAEVLGLEVMPMLLVEIEEGFPYIEKVYSMITEYEPVITD